MTAWDDRTAQSYADAYGRDPSVFAVLAAAGIETGDHVLELGCGSGVVLADLAAVAGRLAGIDPTPRMIDLARAACPGAELRVAGAEATGFGPGAFDVVLGINVVEHFDDRAAAFAEAFRLLRPGGRLVIGGELHDPSMLETPQEYRADLIAAGFAGITRRDLGEAYVQIGRRPDV